MTENFLNTKGKAFVIFLSSIVSLIILAAATKAAILLRPNLNGVIIGSALMVVAIPLHILGKKLSFFYLLSFAANFIGCGFSVSAYYLSKDIPLNIPESAVAAIPAAAVLFLVYLILKLFPNGKIIIVPVATVINLGLLIYAIIFWIRTGDIFYSFGFFCLVVSLFFIFVFGISINHDERPVLRDISFGSFGIFLIVTIVVLFILSEGEILEMLGLDFDVSGQNSKKKGKI